jgi:hypothetical protein
MVKPHNGFDVAIVFLRSTKKYKGSILETELQSELNFCNFFTPIPVLLGRFSNLSHHRWCQKIRAFFLLSKFRRCADMSEILCSLSLVIFILIFFLTCAKSVFS